MKLIQVCCRNYLPGCPCFHAKRLGLFGISRKGLNLVLNNMHKKYRSISPIRYTLYLCRGMSRYDVEIVFKPPNLQLSFVSNDESCNLAFVRHIFHGNSWSLSTVCCWCNDTHYVFIRLYDDVRDRLSFARLARVYTLYCCCYCNLIFYFSVLSGVIQV